MGFEARETILDCSIRRSRKRPRWASSLYDLSESEVIGRIAKLKKKLRSSSTTAVHGDADSAKRQAANAPHDDGRRSQREAPAPERLQHNEMIIVDGTKTKKVVCGRPTELGGFFLVDAAHLDEGRSARLAVGAHRQLFEVRPIEETIREVAEVSA